MANRRMISKSISVSDETNSISDFAALLFTWLIPHADDYGVISGSPGRIKALVVPRRSQTEEQVEAALAEMHSVGLIYRYADNGQSYIQLVNFDAHQEGLHKRTAPHNPLYRSGPASGESTRLPEVPGTSRLTEPNPTEPNPTETKGTELNPRSEELSAVVEMLAHNSFRVSSQAETDLILDWTATLPRQWIEAAVKQAALNKARSLKYVDAILQTWQTQYKPADKPWEEEPRHRQRGSPARGSYAMAKLEQMAKEAAKNDTV